MDNMHKIVYIVYQTRIILMIDQKIDLLIIFYMLKKHLNIIIVLSAIQAE